MKNTRTLTLKDDQSALIINPDGKIGYDVPEYMEDKGQDVRSIIFLVGLINILNKDEVTDALSDEIEKYFQNAEKITKESV